MIWLLLAILIAIGLWVFDEINPKIYKALVACALICIVVFIFWLLGFDLVAMLHSGGSRR